MWYLIEKFNINFDLNLINKKLKYYDFKFSKKSFMELADKHEKYFEKELRQLVFGELPTFDECIQTVEKWIR